jgi:hypothetical protein
VELKGRANVSGLVKNAADCRDLAEGGDTLVPSCAGRGRKPHRPKSHEPATPHAEPCEPSAFVRC